ncbi:RAD9, HUS1, RAD1-interacting nuclear orphan protein 1 [Mastacembelus armatus]|uniref:RAD9-HUS1-RAD1 interacting nuclear orphan 1 n=1 Tax=Mastacembelus armatus TaxID=205130 RepID=A0A3Q3SCY8_9TELE|nr:RAD9, HUS1, RAD1-interacting nuclear orphan protein 1 [Mastacembelus armatus]
MPRKALKSDKPPLLFVERPLSGARVQNAPEVRAALNPKEFFTETQAHNSSSLTSWVSPQFNTSLAAAPPVRRGRRKRQPTTGIFEGCTQLSRKNSVCKFPSLSFHTSSRGQSNQPKTTHVKNATESAVVSDTKNQPQRSCQIKRTVSSAQYLETPKRLLASVRKGNAEGISDGAASSSRCLNQSETRSVQVTERCRIPAEGPSTPASTEFNTSEVSSIGPPPDMDTPEAVKEDSVHLQLAQPCTPPGNQPPDILVADTPERDYGVKVTWRRRRSLMLLLKKKGHLSDSDVLIHS